MPKRKLTYKDFINYFSNNLLNTDKHAFEKNMMQDAFEEEAFDGLSKLNDDDLEKDIAELKSGIRKKTNKTRRIFPVWFKYAASVIIIIGVGISLFEINNRVWQNSLLKDQISQEMEKADSILIEAEKKIQEIKEKSVKDSTENKVEEFMADNKKIKKKEKADVEKVDIEIETKIVLDEIIEENAELIELDKKKVMLAFTEEEDFVVEEFESEQTPVEEYAAKEEIFISEDSGYENIMSHDPRNVSKSARKKDSKRLAKGVVVVDSKTKTIKGRVVSAEDDMSIPGVSIVVKNNPGIGTSTNIEGEFELSLPDDEELRTLIAQFVGMEMQEISILGDTNILVYMEADVMEMDEVVVTAYGTSSERSEVSYVNAKPPQSLSMRKYKEEILKNLNYSKLSNFRGKYKIKISIEIAASGRIVNIIVNNSPDDVFDIEIEKVIERMGRWIPASENGQYVSSSVRFNLKIELE